jgi:hypothetical protein
MTSLPSHTMVPTATGSGRFTARTAWEYVAEVVTVPLCAICGHDLPIPKMSYSIIET